MSMYLSDFIIPIAGGAILNYAILNSGILSHIKFTSCKHLFGKICMWLYFLSKHS